MRPIRVALGRMPRLMRDIVVRTVESETDMQIVGEAADATEVEVLLRREQVDALVLDVVDDDAPRSEDRVLRSHGGVKLLVLSEGGRKAALHWMEPRLSTWSDLSPEALVGVIRAACRPEDRTNA